MKIYTEKVIDAPLDQVWQIVGPEFGSVSNWASMLATSKPTQSDSLQNDAPCSGRVCQTNNGMGGFEETIFHYDSDKKEIGYRAKGDKMPSFVKGLSNKWKLEALSDGRTHIRTEMDMEISFPFNLFPGPVMKMQMSGMMKKVMEELSHYAETGKLHPRTAQSAKTAQVTQPALS